MRKSNHLRTLQIFSFLLIFGACGREIGPSVDLRVPQDKVGLVNNPELSQNNGALDSTLEFLDEEIDNYRNLLLTQHFETKKRVRRATVVQVSWTVGYLEPIDVRNATVLEYFHCDTGHYLLYNWYQDTNSFERETRLAEWNGDTFVDVGVLFTTAKVSTIETHFVGNKLLIAIMNFQFAENTYEGISQVVEFDPDTLTTTILQTILTYGASGVTFFDYESETYLVVTNKRRDDYDKYSSELSIYQYMGMHFDRVVSHPTSGASDIVSFEYESFVYLVIGQFVDNDGNYDVGTAVYLFDSDNSQLKDVQILETSAVTDLEIFKISYEIYLAVANSRDSVTGSYDTNSYIFWWSGHQFVKYQSIPSYGATQWRYQLLEGENSLLFLADYSIPECLRIFEMDDEGDWVDTHVMFFAENQAFGTANESVAIESFEIDGSVYLLISKTLATQDDYNSFYSNFFVFIEGRRNVTVPETDPLIVCQNKLAVLCNQTDVNITEVARVLNTTLKYSGDQETIGNIQIGGNVIVQDIFKVINLTTHEGHDFNIDPEFIEQVEKVSADIQKLQSHLPNLVSLYDDETIQAYTIFQEALKVNETFTGNISALYFGGTVLHTCVSPSSGNHSLADVAGCIGQVDIQEIDKDALRLEGDQNVTSHVIFLDTLIVEKNITVGNKLNGLTIPDELLLTYSDQEVSGTITFDNSVTFQSSVEVKGQLNGLDVETDIVTTSQSYSIGGFKQFTQDVTMEAPTAMADGKTVDEVDLSEFEMLVVALNGTSHIFGNLTFENTSVFDADITLANDLINDVNITELAEQVVTKNTTQTISGAKHFQGDLIVAGNMSVSGDVNSVDLSVEVVPLATTQTVHTPIRVENITSEESIIVQGTVNGIDLSDDVVLTSGNQTINGRVNFTRSVTTTGNLLFPSGIKIDTVDVSELEQALAKTTGTQTLSGKIRFEEPVEILDNISVDGLINGINISALNDEALSKSKAQTVPSDLQLSANITFDQDVTVNGTMDGYRISYFIPLKGETEIRGLKHFSDPMTVSGYVNVDDGMTTNCADLSEFVYEVFLIDGIQTLIAPNVIFTGRPILRDDLIVEGLINGINTTSDLVTLDGQQTVQGKKIFSTERVVFREDLNTTNLRVGGTLQGEDVNDFFQNAVQNNTNTWIDGEKYFGTLTLLGDLNVTGLVDGVDLLEYSLTVVTLDGNQEISGNWRITSSVEFQDDVSITDSVNTVDISNLAERTVYKNRKQDVYGQKEIVGYVTVTGNMDISGLINSLDLVELDEEYFSKSRKQSLEGKKIISQSASLYDLFIVNGALLDGVLPGDLALASENTTVTALVFFVKDVKVLQDMVVGGLVNSVDLVQLNNSAVWRNSPATISGRKHFQGRFAVIGNITTSAFVNGIDISELVLKIFNSHDNVTISVPVIFYGPVKVLGNWNMSGLFHNVDINFIMRDAVLTVGNQVIYGDKYFSNPSEVSISNLEVVGDLRTDALTPTGVSLEHLLNNTVTASTDQDIEGEVTIASDVVIAAHVIVTGEIDGLDLSENAVLITGEQEITSSTHFKKGFTILGNLSISGLVDTVDLEAFVNTRFSLTKSQVVEGKWIFRKDVYMDDLVFTKKINDIDPATDPVFPDRNHTITGRKIFRGQVIIDGDADIHVVNGINLYNISKIVLKHGDYDITGEKTFLSNVTLTENITVTGLVDGVDLQELWWKEYGTMSCLNFDLYRLDWQLSQLCFPAYSLQVAAFGLAVAFLYFEDWGEITNPAGAKTDVVNLEGASLLAVSETHLAPIQRCISTELHICPDPVRECWKVTDIERGSSSVEVFKYNGSTFVIVTPSAQNTYCAEIGDTSQTIVYKLEDSSWNATLETPGAIKATAFEIDGVFYIAVANFKYQGSETTNSFVFKYDLFNDSFSLIQELTTHGAESVASLDDGTNQWLAFANGDGQTYSTIFKWQSGLEKFTASSSIRTTYASDVILFSFEGSTYAFFSNKMKLTYEGILDYNQPIALYQYTPGAGWMWSQYLECPQTVDLDFFAVNDIPYLVAVSHQGFISIFQWTYPSSFQFHISIPVEGVEEAKSFVQGNDLFMAVTQPRYGKEDYPSGRIKILKAVIRSKNDYLKLETF